MANISYVQNHALKDEIKCYSGFAQFFFFVKETAAGDHS